MSTLDMFGHKLCVCGHTRGQHNRDATCYARVAGPACTCEQYNAITHCAYVEIDLESFRRGGSARTAKCTCGWTGPQRGTLELAADDALLHEGAKKEFKQ